MDLPNPGVKPRYPALQADSLLAEPQGEPKNTGVGSLFLLQQIFPAQELNHCLLHCRRILYQLSYEGSPDKSRWRIKEQRCYFAYKGPYNKSYGFPVIMYGCEIWMIKKTEHQRIDAFKLWYWRRLLTVPWTARRSNQSVLKEINPEYSLEWLMLKLKLQYFGYLMWRVDSLEKTLMLGKIEGRRRRGWQRMRWFGWHHWHNGHEIKQTPGHSEGQGGLVCCSSWGHKELDMTKWLNNSNNNNWCN